MTSTILHRWKKRKKFLFLNKTHVMFPTSLQHWSHTTLEKIQD